jgi:hypothetical protein
MLKLADKPLLAAALRCAAALLGSVITGSAAQATPIEFADFHLLNANQSLSFTNNGGTSASITAASVPVIFDFTAQSGLSTADHNGILTISNTPTTTPASSFDGGLILDQPISVLTTLSIIENGTGKDLLTMSFTGNLVGESGSPDASLLGAESSGQIVAFSSSFATFSGSSESYNLGLDTISPSLSLGAGGFLSSFAANIDGQFTAGITPIPEPSSAILFAIGLLLTLGALAYRKAASTAQ